MSDTKKARQCRAALLVSFDLPDNFDDVRLDLLNASERNSLFLNFLKESDDVHLGYGVQYVISNEKIKALRKENPSLTDAQIAQLADGFGYTQVINDMMLLRIMRAESFYRLENTDDDKTEPNG